MKNYQKGFIGVTLVIISALIIGAGISYFYFNNTKKNVTAVSTSLIHPEVNQSDGNLSDVDFNTQISTTDGNTACQKSQTQSDLNICAVFNEQKAQKELDADYIKLEARYGTTTIQNTGVAWRNFMILQCDDANGARADNGSIWEMNYANCLNTLIRSHINDLKSIYTDMKGTTPF